MRLGNVRVLGLVILLVAGPGSSAGQSTNRALAPNGELKTGSSSAGLPAGGALEREIDDPHLGNRWLLTRDPSHPGGPGRLIPVVAGKIETLANAGIHASPAPSNQRFLPRSLPVIRTGDRLIVEENTALVDARLEAVALAPAHPGSPFKVRLVAGGKVVRVVALGPGRAAFAPVRVVQP